MNSTVSTGMSAVFLGLALLTWVALGLVVGLAILALVLVASTEWDGIGIGIGFGF